MTTAQLDPQKIEKLLKAATSQRQRKMYQTLLDKARKQEKDTTAKEAPETTPSTAKKTQSTPKKKTKAKKKTKTESSPLPPTSTETAPSNIEPAPQTELKSQSPETQTAVQREFDENLREKKG